MVAGQRAAQPVPRSCIRNQSRENLLKRTKIVLAVPSFDRQRLSGIRRGWCPSISRKTERVIRSDSGDAHRLSLSARVLSTMVSQVKAKPTAAEALLTSMKTTLERCIWPSRLTTAIRLSRPHWGAKSLLGVSRESLSSRALDGQAGCGGVYAASYPQGYDNTRVLFAKNANLAKPDQFSSAGTSKFPRGAGHARPGAGDNRTVWLPRR
jgi:hypothetical protein